MLEKNNLFKNLVQYIKIISRRFFQNDKDKDNI